MTFKRPTSAGWATLAIAGLCAVGFVDAAFAQAAAPAADGVGSSGSGSPMTIARRFESGDHS